MVSVYRDGGSILAILLSLLVVLLPSEFSALRATPWLEAT